MLHTSPPCLLGWAGSCSQSPECCAGAGNGECEWRISAWNEQDKKKSYTALPLLQNRLVDWQQTLYNSSFQADGKIMICSSVTIFCCLSQPNPSPHLPIKRALGCFICVLQGSHQSLGINIVTSYRIPFCKNLPQICLQHLLADRLQIIAAEIHTKATGKFLSTPDRQYSSERLRRCWKSCHTSRTLSAHIVFRLPSANAQSHPKRDAGMNAPVSRLL